MPLQAYCTELQVSCSNTAYTHILHLSGRIFGDLTAVSISVLVSEQTVTVILCLQCVLQLMFIAVFLYWKRDLLTKLCAPVLSCKAASTLSKVLTPGGI